MYAKNGKSSLEVENKFKKKSRTEEKCWLCNGNKPPIWSQTSSYLRHVCLPEHNFAKTKDPAVAIKRR